MVPDAEPPPAAGPPGWRPSDYAEEIAILDQTPPLWAIIGGMAAIIWTDVFLSPAEAIGTGALFPLASKDLDLRGGRVQAQAIKDFWKTRMQRWDWKTGGRQVWATSTHEPGNPLRRTIEISGRVPGLDEKEGTAVRLTYQGMRLRVLDPISCLRAKADVLRREAAGNAAGARKDHIHLRLLLLIVPRYLERLGQVPRRAAQARAEHVRAGAAMEEAAAALAVFEAAVAARLPSPPPAPAEPKEGKRKTK